MTTFIQVLIALPKIFAFIRDSLAAWKQHQEQVREAAHKAAVARLKAATTEDEKRKALDDLAKNP